MDYELGLIGGGNMAEAIVKPALDQSVLDPGRIIIADPSPDRRRLFEDLGVATTEANAAVATSAEQVMIAVKPQMLDDIAETLRQIDPDNQVILSIMAGISTTKIEQTLGTSARIIRIMPNTPLLAGAGMAAISLGPNARQGDEALALRLFQAAGDALTLDEKHMDAVTAVSGSGPAYVFYLAEAMSEAARSLGLDDNLADRLVRQTVFGAAKLMREAPETPAELRQKVASPGGTTQAALEFMDAQQVSAHIQDAVRRAADRSRELGG